MKGNFDTDKLSGRAIDVLYSLFWFGPREAGEIPSNWEAPAYIDGE